MTSSEESICRINTIWEHCNTVDDLCLTTLYVIVIIPCYKSRHLLLRHVTNPRGLNLPGQCRNGKKNSGSFNSTN